MSKTCATCFYSDRIRRVAHAPKLISYIKYELRKNSMHLAIDFHIGRVKKVRKFFFINNI